MRAADLSAIGTAKATSDAQAIPIKLQFPG